MSLLKNFDYSKFKKNKLIKGENVMLGYWNKKEETEKNAPERDNLKII